MRRGNKQKKVVVLVVLVIAKTISAKKTKKVRHSLKKYSSFPLYFFCIYDIIKNKITRNEGVLIMFEKFLRTVLTDTSDCIYYLVDIEANKIAYVNDVACDLLRIPQDSYRGIRCFEHFYTKKECCEVCDDHPFHQGILSEDEIKERVTHLFPIFDSTNLMHQGKKYRFVLASKHPLTLPSIFDETPTFDQAMIRCASALMKETDVHRALEDLVQVSCVFYCSLQSSLLEIDEKNQIILETHIATSESLEITKEGSFHGISSGIFDQWLEDFSNNEEIFVTHSSQQVKGELRDFLKKENIHSFILAPLKDSEEIIAYLLIQNPRALEIDLRFVQSVILFLQEGLQKRTILKELENIQDHDLLTGFLNHKKYSEKMYQLLKKPPETLGIVFIDLLYNNEKNAQLSEYEKDIKVRHSAMIVESFFKEQFYRVKPEKFLCFVANSSKDEFLASVGHLRHEVGNSDSFSIGYLWEFGKDDIYEMLHDVEHVMTYEAVDDYYSDYKTSSTIVQEMSVQKDLLNAIESKEFEIYFQPKVQLDSRKVVGAEALVRRKATTESDFLYPSIFVKLYEEQAIIRHLDLYVVEEVCRTLARWIESGIALPISVNFSRVTLTEYGIVGTICDICDLYHVPYHLLTIEFTERIAMMNEKAYEQIADDFEKKGFLLSLDDFGAAYSNLITLAKINIDEIKIDQSLIKDMESDRKNQIVLKGIVDMCNLIETVSPLAEGIETEFQAEKLLEYGCILGQGNLFSPPIPTKEFYEKYLI